VSRASEGRRRLRLVAQLLARDPEDSVAAIACSARLSRQRLHQLVQVARAALEPRTPGPQPGDADLVALRKRLAQLEARCAAAEARVDALQQQAREEEGRRQRTRDRLELVCFASNVSLRDTQEIIEVALGPAWRPGRGSLHRRLQAAGRTAQDLLARGRAQVADELVCVMADDVYFHQRDVRVVAEPESVAMLNVGHWQGSSGLDWVVWLEEYTSLKLLCSDLGKDLVGAATQLGVRQCADAFHELRWLGDKLLDPLSKAEAKARAVHMEMLDRATRVEGPGRRLSPAKVAVAQQDADRLEDAFFVGVDVTDRLWTLYQSINPKTGRLWTDAEVEDAFDAMLQRLLTIDHPAARRAHKHLRCHRARYTAHRVMIDQLDVPLMDGTGWSSRGVLNGLLALWEIQRQQTDPDAWVDYATWLDRDRLARDLEQRLRAACPQLDEVASRLRRELRVPKRSSSGVESLNSRLRVLQMVHRTVSDEMLGLVALAWNLTPRRHHGWRKGRSPYEMLGVDIGQGDKPWYDVLLDAQASHQAAA